MQGSANSILERIFRRIVAARWSIVAVYALVLPIGVLLALRVPSDNSLDRLIVPSDPDSLDTREFQKIFPEGQNIVLLAESKDPFAPEALAKFAAIEERLARVRSVEAFSALTIFRRVRPDFSATPEHAEAFRRFATGTKLFRKQGLVGDGFLGIPVELRVVGQDERNEALAAIDHALAPIEADRSPLTAIRRVGGPYLDAYLEGETARATARSFPLFGLFVIALNLFLYRSKRTLAAFLITLAVAVALTVGFAALVGYAFTIVSSLVPLTVLITCTATLVYIHSRFVEHPDGILDVDHQVFALANKFVACTASIFAAAVGFAALAVSGIRPIREMGLWVSAGLAITWVTVFTLFPALQRILATPTQQERRIAGGWFPLLIARIPAWSYRWRFVLVAGSLLLLVAGAVALFGIPGLVEPMRLETDALDYIDESLPVYQDTRRFEQAISGLTVAEVWVRTPSGAVLDASVLRGLDRFSERLERDGRIGSVVGPTTMLRWMRYVGGGGDRLPTDPAAWGKLAADLEQLLLREASLRSYIDVGSLSDARLQVITRGSDFGDVRDLKSFLQQAWDEAAAAEPAMASCSMKVVGQGILQSKIAHYLVPTLVESFAITAVIIFVTFLLVFRSGAARLMAMIPSLFAILVMFLFMRVTGMALNVATILIASTVLGASENDQIHFFYHFQERRRTGTTEESMRHALLIAGRAILFATLINAGGFLALALSDLPPMRQFGILSAGAFLLSMLADFTVLPAALWIFFRERPDAPGERSGPDLR